MATTSPISNLDDDILLTIFEINTEPIPANPYTDHRPLKIVRLTSHVCQRWRNLLLASSLIWGRVVDLDVVRYGPRRREWMEAIIKRAGSASLWISGAVIRPMHSDLQVKVKFDTESFFIRLLEFWERVEKLVVVIYDRKISEDIQRRFLSRAPILKLFDVQFPEIKSPLFLDTLQPGSSESLFADYAPSLVTIKAEKMAFKLDSPWLSNLHKIISFPSRWSVSEVMILLQHTPLLGTIILSTPLYLVWKPEQPLLPKVTLRNLSVIHLQSTLGVVATILDHVAPGQLSTLRIVLLNITTTPADQDLLYFKKSLLFYVSNFLTTSTSTTILFEFSMEQFRFRDVTSPSLNAMARGHISFDVNIIRAFRSFQGISDTVLAAILGAFTLPPSQEGSQSHFKSIGELRLKFTDVRPTLFTELYSMLSTFQHAQVIEINEDFCHTLSCLSCLEGQRVVLFPELHTVRLTFLHHNDDPSDKFNHLAQFFMKRKEIGHPVARLDLTSKSWTSQYVPALNAFEQIEGLEVIWK